ncbi:17430_t:CDS:2, partial [Gigaspora rosea]
MTIAYNNEVKERRRWWFSYREKNRRVTKLIQEKFAIQLLLKQCHTNSRNLQTKLNTCQADLGEYDEDIDIFNSRLSSYLAGAGIDPVANRDQAFGILRGCLHGRALEWFDRKILGKQWELHNIFANHGQAGMGALRGRTMAQMITSNSFRNPSTAHDYANTAGNNAVTVGVSMIPAEAFTEDWRLAGGRPSDRPVNAINAGNANPIVFGDIRIGQALYWLRNEYPTVISEKRNLVYGSLAQGGEPIGEFYSKLLKYGKMLNLDEQQIKGQFLRGLSPDLEDDAERIGTEQPLADLFEILERIEMRRAEKKLGLVSKIPQSSYKSSSKLMTPAQYHPVSSQSVSQLQDRQLVRPSQMEPGKIYSDPNLRLNDQEWLRMDNTLDRLSATTNNISYLQNIMDIISKGVIDKISPLLSKKSSGNSSTKQTQPKNIEVDSDEELANLTQRQLKLH